MFITLVHLQHAAHNEEQTMQLVKASFNLGFHAVETYTVENASQNTLLLHLHA